MSRPTPSQATFVIGEAERRRRLAMQSTNTDPLARPRSETNVTWLPTRPNFAIRYVSGTSTSRGYHESYYEVVSHQELDADDFRRLSECGLLGIGQAYDVCKSETFEEDAPPVTVDRWTGQVLPDVPPTSWDGKPITKWQSYTWHRYEVRRICDSGD